MMIPYAVRLRRLAAATLLGLLALPVWAQDQAPGVEAPEHLAHNSSKGVVAALTRSMTPTMEDTMRPLPPPIMHELESTVGADEAPIFDTAGQAVHPLTSVLCRAREGMENIEKIRDYSATIAKRERRHGKVRDYQYVFVKVRHEPFSVYATFLAPACLKGQQCLYVEGQNNGKMWARGAGMLAKAGTVSIAPDSPIGMRGQRYPVTETGVLNLVRRLVEVAQQDIQYGECDVKSIEGAKINDRTCTVIQVVHPVPRRNFRFHIARIFIDDELNVPIRYEAYDWPDAPGEKPQLIEEYTYLNLKFNQGFTDEDFSRDNPNYELR